MKSNRFRWCLMGFKNVRLLMRKHLGSHVLFLQKSVSKLDQVLTGKSHWLSFQLKSALMCSGNGIHQLKGRIAGCCFLGDIKEDSQTRGKKNPADNMWGCVVKQKVVNAENNHQLQ